MRLTSILIAALGSLAAAADLGIEVTHAVECTRKTTSGDGVAMHYRGTLQSDGSEFDSSYKRKAPLTFKLGTGRVIKG
jgi:FK506-binding protein 2